MVALGRYLGMAGKMGYIPDWYEAVCIADRLHCKVWELSEVSVYYQDIGRKAIQAENRGRDIRAQHKQ